MHLINWFKKEVYYNTHWHNSSPVGQKWDEVNYFYTIELKTSPPQVHLKFTSFALFNMICYKANRREGLNRL